MNITTSINVALAMKNKTSKELALHIGVATQTVYNWKAQIQQPRLPQLIKMAEFFEMKVSEFIALGEDK